jgi:hypothetical protein
MKDIRKIFFYLLIVPFLYGFSAANAQTDKRSIAMDVLKEAFQKEMTGNRDEAIKLVVKSLSIDPDLAQANLVRAEFAVDHRDWETAKRYYQKGLVLIDQPDQPLSPESGIEITKSEVKGTSKCMLGLVYIMLSKNARDSGDDLLEYEYILKAKKQINDGLKLDPIPSVRVIAEDIIKKYGD